MVYRGSLQTDDPRDAPKLVRISPLRSSRPVNPVPRVTTTVKGSIYHNAYATPIDMNRARMIEERRLGRERDIESVEKAIMRNTGMKIGAPKLRNISQIRETIFVDQPLTTIEKTGRVDSRNRPRSVAVGLEDGNARQLPRTHSSLLADLKDLERLRNTPSTQRNHRGPPQRSERPDSRSTISNKKGDVPTSAKIRSDIFKIQQMFQSADPAPRGTIRNGNGRKIKSDSEKEEKKHGTEINRTRLLAQKLLEASRSNREFLKDRCNNPRNACNKTLGRDVNGKSSSKILQEIHKIPEESWNNKEEQEEQKEPILEEQPRPPVRRRRNSRYRGWKDADRADERASRSEDRGIRCPPDHREGSSNGGASTDENSKASSNLERPDILDGLLKESSRQLANLRNDLGERGRSRSHWRGFVQSMRLHDVELHSDGEDQRKGKCERLSYICIYAGHTYIHLIVRREERSVRCTFVK